VSDDTIVNVVCDGCGTKPYSEVGARLGSQKIPGIILKQVETVGSLKDIDWGRIEEEVLQLIGKTAEMFCPDDNITNIFTSYFQFSVVVMIIKKDEVMIASCGDGVFAHDEKVFVIEPPIPNAPPYLIYRMVKSKGYVTDEHTRFKIVYKTSLSKVKNCIMIGSDGATSLMKNKLEMLQHPGYFVENGEERLQSDLERIIFTQELYLPDDTTICMVRTNAMQEKLLAKRMPIVELRGQLKEKEQEIYALEEERVEMLGEIQALTRERDALKRSQFSFFNRGHALVTTLTTQNQKRTARQVSTGIKSTPPAVKIVPKKTVGKQKKASSKKITNKKGSK
jgi:hypothetical protein